jgi:hypothetical protein
MRWRKESNDNDNDNDVIDEKCTFWSENRKGRDHSEKLGIDGKIILERILGK